MLSDKSNSNVVSHYLNQKAANYINQAQQVINNTNQQANTNLSITFRVQQQNNQVQIIGFID